MVVSVIKFRSVIINFELNDQICLSTSYTMMNTRFTVPLCKLPENSENDHIFGQSTVTMIEPIIQWQSRALPAREQCLSRSTDTGLALPSLFICSYSASLADPQIIDRLFCFVLVNKYWERYCISFIFVYSIGLMSPHFPFFLQF